MSKYLKCKWFHSYPEHPILMYSELDAERFETRKVEVFQNNTYGYASDNSHTPNTELGWVEVPSLDEINQDMEFEAEYISKG